MKVIKKMLKFFLEIIIKEKLLKECLDAARNSFNSKK